MELFTALFTALDRANVRYVVVGGLATVLHGHPRLTADVDLVIDLGPEPSRRAMMALQEPLDFEDLWRASEAMDLGPCKVHVASIPHLIALKSVAGRPQDLLDIEALEEIQRRRKETDRG